jgi:hypothetical protein
VFRRHREEFLELAGEWGTAGINMSLLLSFLKVWSRLLSQLVFHAGNHFRADVLVHPSLSLTRQPAEPTPLKWEGSLLTEPSQRSVSTGTAVWRINLLELTTAHHCSTATEDGDGK